MKRNIQKTRFVRISVGENGDASSVVYDPAKLTLDSISLQLFVQSLYSYTIFLIVHHSDTQEVIPITIATKLSGYFSLFCTIWHLNCPVIGPLECRAVSSEHLEDLGTLFSVVGQNSGTGSTPNTGLFLSNSTTPWIENLPNDLHLKFLAFLVFVPLSSFETWSQGGKNASLSLIFSNIPLFFYLLFHKTSELPHFPLKGASGKKTFLSLIIISIHVPLPAIFLHLLPYFFFYFRCKKSAIHHSVYLSSSLPFSLSLNQIYMSCRLELSMNQQPAAMEYKEIIHFCTISLFCCYFSEAFSSWRTTCGSSSSQR